jgi:uncharacterized protein (TIGR03790 family)
VAWIIILAALILLCPEPARSGGTGLNVLIVANQMSSNSCELANYYRVQRSIPPENVLRISWSGSNIQWTSQEFTNSLLNPVLAFVSRNQLSNQIHFVVLSMDIPYRITGTQENSTTAALYYGFKGGTSDLENSYALSEGQLCFDKPDTAPTNSFLTMMLTANTIGEAKHMIDQGVAGDGTFPAQKAWLAKSPDPLRNTRYRKFDNAIFNTRLCKGYYLARTNQSSPIGFTNLLGYQTGTINFSISPDAFIPGALADNMTSFGGQIFENSGQTTLLEFIQHGAAGSYGTVTEPLVSLAKFPDPMVYFYQSRGFCLAECYYQSVQQPFQGLFVGDPLSTPWRHKFYGGWVGVETNAVLKGTTNLCLSLSSDHADLPLTRLDLFLDGRYLQTLTTIPPQAGNQLALRLNGYPIEYIVPTNATLHSIAAGLAAELNKSANTNITKVAAQAVGDRIELKSYAVPLPEGVFELVDSDATLAEPRTYLAAPSTVSLSSSVSAAGWTGDGQFRVQLSSTPGISNVLQASTNLFDWTAVYTNVVGGSIEFMDPEAALFPSRFYRVALPPATPTPYLHSMGVNASNQFGIEITSPTNRPYVLQASSDFISWSDVLTNDSGSDDQFLDGAYPEQPLRYYRTRSAVAADYAPLSIVGQTETGGNILHVEDIVPGEIVVWSSTNGTDWLPIFFHEGSPNIQTATSSTPGAAEPLTTHLQSASSEFLRSTAIGVRSFTVLDFPPPNGLIAAGEYLKLSVIKTNGATFALSLTNYVPNATLSNFVDQFVATVNAEQWLQGPDGLVAEDLTAGAFTASRAFNLRARSSGQDASQIQASLQTSAGLLTIPTGMMAINENASDLLPRNHLYVRAGVSSLMHSFDLDTTTLADGYHELSAVAYEGTHVNSQTIKPMPVVIDNTPLEATLALAAGGSTFPVDQTFTLVSTVNLVPAETILLFTTGGFYDGRTNVLGASFTVFGQDLGIGEHPFYALVTHTNGVSYRTATLNISLTK